MFIDPDPAHPQLVDLRQQHRGGVDRGLDRPPGDPERIGDLGDGPA
jgi:hypothetical protein